MTELQTALERIKELEAEVKAEEQRGLDFLAEANAIVAATERTTISRVWTALTPFFRALDTNGARNPANADQTAHFLILERMRDAMVRITPALPDDDE